jgi:hypothetical protein
MSYPDRLDVGARREIFATDGRGGGEWIAATAAQWGPDNPDDVGYIVFRLDRPGPQGQQEVSVPCEPTSIGTLMRPIQRKP